LGHTKEIVGEVFVDKDRLLQDLVLQQAEMGTARQTAVHVLKALDVGLEGIPQASTFGFQR
jgi:hypothetical protein